MKFIGMQTVRCTVCSLLLITGLRTTGSTQNFQGTLESLRYVVRHSEEDTLYVNTLNLIANLHWRMGNYSFSKDSAVLALAVAAKINYLKGQRDAYDNLGEAAFYMKQYDEAIAIFRNTIALSGMLYDSVGIAYGYRQLGWLFQHKNDFNNALIQFDSALIFSMAIRDTIRSTELLSRKVMIYTALGELDKARQIRETLDPLRPEKGHGTPGFANPAFLSGLYADMGLAHASASQERQRRILTSIIIALILIGTVIGIFWYRKKKQLERLQAVMSERLRISRDLHDEVGSTLSGIVMYSHLAKQEVNQPSNMGNQYLDVVQETASAMVNKLNDVVWLVNPKQDKLTKLLERLEEFGQQVCAAKQMHFVMNREITVEVELPIEFRKNIYLICKEAINNAAKYSQANTIVFAVQADATFVSLAIEDDGVGFDPAIAASGNGLRNMQERAEANKMEIAIETAPNKGTKVTIVKALV